jgi:hypothetical protein
MNRLSFEDLMELFSDAKKERNFDEITKINKEFERRVKKRKLMGKKPIRTSLSGLNQTSEWLNNNSGLEYLSNQTLSKSVKDKTSKIRNKNLREPTDINKKKSLW